MSLSRRAGAPAVAGLLACAALAAAGVAVTSRAQTPPAAAPFKRLSWSQFLARPQPQPQAKIAYGPGAQQFGELWLPEGAGPHPLVVLIHGGCWTKSVAKLSIMNAAAEDLRKRGAAVWNIEYRGVDEAGGGYPGTYQDVADALDRIGGFADEAQLNLDKVVVVGHSAGGQLALWAAARRKIASGPLVAKRGPPISAVVDISGLPNLATDTETACGASPVEAMAGPARLGGRYGDTSPAHMLPIHVRQLVVVGREDQTVPPAVSEAYVRLARNAGDRVDYRVLPDAAHVEEIAPGTAGWDRIAPLGHEPDAVSDHGWVLGVVGGSGLYEIDGLVEREWREVASPWGAPSDAVLHGVLEGVPVRFLPRHGRGHRLSPSHLNYRANLDALKRCGVTDVLSLSAVGSLRESFAPGEFVAVDQFVDRTVGRASSFFGEGVVAHVSMADPVCRRLTALAAAAAGEAGARVHVGGTYLAMEGPQFSTRAESRMYRAWGCDVIGMTNLPEAKLAREAELPYASLGMVTDYDCWRDAEDAAPVEVSHVLEVMHANAALARAALKRLCAELAGTPRTPSPIDTGLDPALVTPPEHRDPALVAKLDAVAGRALAR